LAEITRMRGSDSQELHYDDSLICAEMIG